MKKQHNLALTLLSLTAIVWGLGFVIGNRLLGNGFNDVPLALNTIRFACGAIFLLAIFGNKLRFDKTTVIFGVIGGVLLCAGFDLQLCGLNISKSPTSCGFFTAAYAVFVPFVAWIVYRKRPAWIMFFGVAVALAGLLVLNIQSISMLEDKSVLIGNMVTFAGSMFFAVQIVLSDYALNEKKADMISLTVFQVCVCAVAMCLASIIFESGKYSSVQVNWGNSWWQLLIVGVFGTAFAYFSQTFSQQHLSPTETSIIMICESPIGAVVSIAIGDDKLTWSVCVGGLLVIASVVLLEVLPKLMNKKTTAPNNAPQGEQPTPKKTEQQSEQPPQD